MNDEIKNFLSISFIDNILVVARCSMKEYPGLYEPALSKLSLCTYHLEGIYPDFVDLNKFVVSLKEAMNKELKKNNGAPYEYILVVPPHNTLSKIVSVELNLGSGKEITQEIIKKLFYETTQKPSFDPAYRPINRVKLFFKVDGVNHLNPPLGIYARKIQLILRNFYIEEIAFKNLIKPFEEMKIGFSKLVVHPICTPEIVLDNEERKIGTTIIGLYKYISYLNIYRHGYLYFSDWYDFGFDNVLEYIEDNLRVSRAVALKLVRKYGFLLGKNIVENFRVEVPTRDSRKTITISLLGLHHLLQEAFSKLINMIKKSIEDNEIRRGWENGLILVGTRCNYIPDFKDYLAEFFDTSSSIGCAIDSSNNRVPTNFYFLPAIGALKFAARGYDISAFSKPPSFFKRIFTRIPIYS